MTFRGVSSRVADKLSSQAATIRRMREDNKQIIQKAERTVLVGVTAAGLGYIEGRYQRTHVGPVPIAAGLGVAAMVAGYAMDEDSLLAVGDGALAVAGYQFMRGIGTDQAAKASGTSTQGWYQRAA